MHTVVAQIERCELAVLVGYSAGTGAPTEQVIARAASQPQSRRIAALRDTLTAFAMAPLRVALDGVPLSPSSVRAKLGFEAGGARPVVVVLVTYPMPRGGELTISSSDPRTTRISWQDLGSGRVDLARAPAAGRYFTGVASFLLPVAAPGGSSCPSAPSTASSNSPAAPASASDPGGSSGSPPSPPR